MLKFSTTSSMDNILSSSFPKGQSNISLPSPYNVTNIQNDEELVDNVFTKAKRNALQVSLEKIAVKCHLALWGK